MRNGLKQKVQDVYDFDLEISMMRKCVETEQPIDTYVRYISNRGQYVRVTGNNFPVRHNEKTMGSVAIYETYAKVRIWRAKLLNCRKNQ